MLLRLIQKQIHQIQCGYNLSTLHTITLFVPRYRSGLAGDAALGWRFSRARCQVATTS
jgi:hypothetical protein